MNRIAYLSDKEIKTILDSMTEELAIYSSQFAFVQLRASSEHFVVPLCGIAAAKVICSLSSGDFHVLFEKKLPRFKQGPVDLVLMPIEKTGEEVLDKPYCFEFKMVWINGIKSNVKGIKRDIQKLDGYERGYAVAILFTFDKSGWVPYSHQDDMKKLTQAVVSGVGLPFYEGHEHLFSSDEIMGYFKLMAWSSSSSTGR
jgi:hypothetical protein